MFTELVVMLLLVLANGVFAGAEIAVITVRKSRLHELAEDGSRGARAVLGLKGSPERFLATVQVGITVVSATAAAVGGASIAAELEPLLAGIPWFEEHAKGVALALVVAGVSYLSIVLGELIPKSLALRAAEPYALVIGRPLLALSWLTRPLVWFLSASANILLKPFGDQTTFSEARYSAEELQELVEEAAKAGTIHPEAGEIVTRALELPALTAAEVMVPRQSVVMISRRATREEARRILLEHPHRRLPVYESRFDNVIGYLSFRDILAVSWNETFDLEKAIRPAYFVPESKRAVELLAEMRERKMAFAMVVDEHGGFAGIVTVEDLLEELVGDMMSEHSAPTPENVVEQTDGSVIANGATTVREINRRLDIELPVDGPWTTVAGLCLALFGHMPKKGEAVNAPDGTRLEVIDATPRRIRALRIRPQRDVEAISSSASM